MADTFTSLLRLVLQETGGNQNVWGDINNASAIDLLEDSIAARLDLDVTPAIDPVMLTTENGDIDQSRNAIIALTGLPGGTRDIIVPSTSKLYIVSNETADDMTIKTVANAGVVVSPATRVAVVVDPVADDVFTIGDIPLATETVAGVAEIATQVEVDAGTDDERFVTPLKLATFPAVNQATETVAGIAELADQAETDAGTDDLRIVTPLKLETRQSTTILTGLARRATQAEVDAGTEVAAFVTPETLENKPGALGTYRGAKAYRSSSFTWPRDDAPNSTFTGPTNAAAAVAYNAEVFDTDTIHDVAVNNSRFLIPAGISKIRIKAGFRFDGDTSGGMGHCLCRKDGSTTLTIDPNFASWIPLELMPEPNGTGQEFGWQSFDTGTITVTGSGTEYFEIYVLSQVGNRDVIANGAWCEVELVE